jgi:hypothetical protein
MTIEFVHGSHDAVLEFLFGFDADVAQHRAGELREEALDEIEPGSVLGREGEFEATFGLVGEPCPGLLGDVRGMIVEDQLDLRMGRVGSVEELEKFDEFAAAMAVPDEGVDLAGQEIDAGQQADRTMALVLVIACEGCVPARFGRKVRGRIGDRLDTGLLVIREDRDRIAWLLFGGRRVLFDESHLAIDAQNLGHLLFDLRIAAFQVISDLVRLSPAH